MNSKKKVYYQNSTMTTSSSPYYSINSSYISGNHKSRMPTISTATTNNTTMTTQSTKITNATIKNNKKVKLTARLDQMFNNLLMNNDYELNKLFSKTNNINNTDFMNDHLLNEKKVNKEAFKVLFNDRRYSNLYDFFSLKSNICNFLLFQFDFN
jgi:hypothetical protein